MITEIKNSKDTKQQSLHGVLIKNIADSVPPISSFLAQMEPYGRTEIGD